jgi:uncharacterized membrane protein YdfJ with MMPL/SSD domain
MNRVKSYSRDFLKENFEKKSFWDHWEKYFPFKWLWVYILLFIVLIFLFVLFIPKWLYYNNEDVAKYSSNDYWEGLETLMYNDPVIFAICVSIITINLLILIIGYLISSFFSDNTV